MDEEVIELARFEARTLLTEGSTVRAHRATQQERVPNVVTPWPRRIFTA